MAQGIRTFFLEVTYTYQVSPDRPGRTHTWRTDVREHSLTSATERARRKFARDHMPEAEIASILPY
jgi:hypothetical protein